MHCRRGGMRHHCGARSFTTHTHSPPCSPTARVPQIPRHGSTHPQCRTTHRPLVHPAGYSCHRWHCRVGRHFHHLPRPLGQGQLCMLAGAHRSHHRSGHRRRCTTLPSSSSTNINIIMSSSSAGTTIARSGQIRRSGIHLLGVRRSMGTLNRCTTSTTLHRNTTRRCTETTTTRRATACSDTWRRTQTCGGKQVELTRKWLG
jgi:hypothetical protein